MGQTETVMLKGLINNSRPIAKSKDPSVTSNFENPTVGWYHHHPEKTKIIKFN